MSEAKFAPENLNHFDFAVLREVSQQAAWDIRGDWKHRRGAVWLASKSGAAIAYSSMESLQRRGLLTIGDDGNRARLLLTDKSCAALSLAEGK